MKQRFQGRHTIMSHSHGRHYAETFSRPPSDHVSPWPISAGKLVSLIDLGWSDTRIAGYFCVDPVKVSALRAYYGWQRGRGPEIKTDGRREAKTLRFPLGARLRKILPHSIFPTRH